MSLILNRSNVHKVVIKKTGITTEQEVELITDAFDNVIWSIIPITLSLGMSTASKTYGYFNVSISAVGLDTTKTHTFKVPVYVYENQKYTDLTFSIKPTSSSYSTVYTSNVMVDGGLRFCIKNATVTDGSSTFSCEDTEFELIGTPVTIGVTKNEEVVYDSNFHTGYTINYVRARAGESDYKDLTLDTDYTISGNEETSAGSYTTTIELVDSKPWRYIVGNEETANRRKWTGNWSIDKVHLGVIFEASMDMDTAQKAVVTWTANTVFSGTYAYSVLIIDTTLNRTFARTTGVSSSLSSVVSFSQYDSLIIGHDYTATVTISNTNYENSMDIEYTATEPRVSNPFTKAQIFMSDNHYVAVKFTGTNVPINTPFYVSATISGYVYDETTPKWTDSTYSLEQYSIQSEYVLLTTNSNGELILELNDSMAEHLSNGKSRPVYGNNKYAVTSVKFKETAKYNAKTFTSDMLSSEHLGIAVTPPSTSYSYTGSAISPADSSSYYVAVANSGTSTATDTSEGAYKVKLHLTYDYTYWSDTNIRDDREFSWWITPVALSDVSVSLTGESTGFTITFTSDKFVDGQTYYCNCIISQRTDNNITSGDVYVNKASPNYSFTCSGNSGSISISKTIDGGFYYAVSYFMVYNQNQSKYESLNTSGTPVLLGLALSISATAKTGLVYNGSSQKGYESSDITVTIPSTGQTSKLWTLSNNTATDAGSYNAIVTVNSGYPYRYFTDSVGTSNPQQASLPWSIAKATFSNPFTVSAERNANGYCYVSWTADQEFGNLYAVRITVTDTATNANFASTSLVATSASSSYTFSDAGTLTIGRTYKVEVQASNTNYYNTGSATFTATKPTVSCPFTSVAVIMSDDHYVALKVTGTNVPSNTQFYISATIRGYAYTSTTYSWEDKTTYSQSDYVPVTTNSNGELIFVMDNANYLSNGKTRPVYGNNRYAVTSLSIQQTSVYNAKTFASSALSSAYLGVPVDLPTTTRYEYTSKTISPFSGSSYYTVASGTGSNSTAGSTNTCKLALKENYMYWSNTKTRDNQDFTWYIKYGYPFTSVKLRLSTSTGTKKGKAVIELKSSSYLISTACFTITAIINGTTYTINDTNNINTNLLSLAEAFGNLNVIGNTTYNLQYYKVESETYNNMEFRRNDSSPYFSDILGTSITAPTVDSTPHVYDGEEYNPFSTGTGYTLSGSKKDVGSYTAYANLDANWYYWSDTNNRTPKSRTYSITRKPIDPPTNNQNVTYTGSEVSPLSTAYVKMVTVSGTSKYTEIKSGLTYTVTPDSNHQWSDGSTSTLSRTWNVVKMSSIYGTPSLGKNGGYVYIKIPCTKYLSDTFSVKYQLWVQSNSNHSAGNSTYTKDTEKTVSAATIKSDSDKSIYIKTNRTVDSTKWYLVKYITITNTHVADKTIGDTSQTASTSKAVSIEQGSSISAVTP